MFVVCYYIWIQYLTHDWWNKNTLDLDHLFSIFLQLLAYHKNFQNFEISQLQKDNDVEELFYHTFQLLSISSPAAGSQRSFFTSTWTLSTTGNNWIDKKCARQRLLSKIMSLLPYLLVFFAILAYCESGEKSGCIGYINVWLCGDLCITGGKICFCGKDNFKVGYKPLKVCCAPSGTCVRKGKLYILKMQIQS